MKKNIPSLLLIAAFSLALLLTSCQSKWDQSDPTMPEELRTRQEEILAEHLATLEEDPENLESLFEVAYRYDQLGELKKAEKYYLKVLELDEGHIVVLNNLASIYERVEEYDKASDAIKRLYELEQDSVEVIKDTVRILLKNRDSLNAEHAVENFAKLVLDPEQPDPAMQNLIQSLYDDIYEWVEENP